MENFGSEELLKLFTQYALKEGSSTLLSTGGLQSLLKNHFSSILGSMSLNEIIKFADIDKDGKISFDDFKTLMSKLPGLIGLSGLAGLTGFGS